MVEPIAEPPLPLRDYLYAEYKTLYRQFKDQAWPLLDEWGRSEWGVIFAMQHHGLPTRLLDWTESFGCSLYFAQRERGRGEPATIWALDPERLNEKTIGQNGIVSIDEITTADSVKTHVWHPRYTQVSRDLPTIAVSPLFSNARMAAQRSRFTMSGDSFQPLDQQYNGSLVSDRILIKIDVPADLYDELDDYLRVSGLRPFTFFPDFEGLRLEHEARIRKYLRELKLFAPHAMKGDDSK
jgi:hypothetical protein